MGLICKMKAHKLSLLYPYSWASALQSWLAPYQSRSAALSSAPANFEVLTMTMTSMYRLFYDQRRHVVGLLQRRRAADARTYTIHGDQQRLDGRRPGRAHRTSTPTNSLWQKPRSQAFGGKAPARSPPLHDRVASAGGVARREGFYLLYIFSFSV
jgi:hypothetical protein